jgi:hypothetical protein
MGNRIAFDGDATAKGAQGVAASHAEVPAAVARTSYSANTGEPASARFGAAFAEDIEGISDEVQKLQGRVAQLLDAHTEAVRLMQQAEQAAAEHASTLATELETRAVTVITGEWPTPPISDAAAPAGGDAAAASEATAPAAPADADAAEGGTSFE